MENGVQTNNRAEYMAVILALETACDVGIPKVEVRTDSQLLVNSLNYWMWKWEQNNWRKKKGEVGISHSFVNFTAW